jgi:hypothetical protein
MEIFLKDKDNNFTMDSELHPKHAYKVGYFRSYNCSTGLNNVFKDMGLNDLWDIFNVRDVYEKSVYEEYYTNGIRNIIDYVPKWTQAKIIVQDLLIKVKSKDFQPYAVSEIKSSSHNDFNINRSNVITEYKAHLADKFPIDPTSGTFTYFQNICKIVSVVAIKDSTFIIYEIPSDIFIEYIYALEIVLETIDYVLNSGRVIDFSLDFIFIESELL